MELLLPRERLAPLGRGELRAMPRSGTARRSQTASPPILEKKAVRIHLTRRRGFRGGRRPLEKRLGPTRYGRACEQTRCWINPHEGDARGDWKIALRDIPVCRLHVREPDRQRRPSARLAVAQAVVVIEA